MVAPRAHATIESEQAVSAILHEVRDTLQISWVPDAFEALGKVPAYLRLAWAQLQPALQTEQFVRLADRLARDATAAVQSLYIPSYGPGDLQQLGIDLEDQAMVRSALSALIFGQSQTILAIKALRLALENTPPGGRETISWPRPARTWALQPIPAADAHIMGEWVRLIVDTAEHLLGLPYPPLAFRVVARWPKFLELAWQDLDAVFRTPEFGAAQTEIIEEAVQLCDLFPARVNATPAWLQSQGLTRLELDRVREILFSYDSALPSDLLITTCLRYPLAGNLPTSRSWEREEMS